MTLYQLGHSENSSRQGYDSKFTITLLNNLTLSKIPS